VGGGVPVCGPQLPPHASHQAGVKRTTRRGGSAAGPFAVAKGAALEMGPKSRPADFHDEGRRILSLIPVAFPGLL
jgi:hypothetical protein